MEKLRIFKLLLHKNFLIRKRHWKLSLFVEIMIPLLLSTLVEVSRNLSAKSAIEIKDNTYYPILSLNDLLEVLDVRTSVYYAPNNNFTNSLMGKVVSCLTKVSPNELLGFKDEDELLKYYRNQQKESSSDNDIVAVIFNNQIFDISTKNLSYTIRLPFFPEKNLYEADIGYSLDRIFVFASTQAPFTQFQICLDLSFLKMNLEASGKPEMEITIQRMPDPPHIKVDFLDSMTRIVICIFALVTFLIILCVELVFIANEKYIGINVLMEMNGVPTYLNLLSWLVSGIVFNIIYITCLIILYNMQLTENANAYIYHGNSFILWVVLLAIIGHLLTFGMHIASYFSRSSFMIFGIVALYIGSSMMQKFFVKGRAYSIVPYLGIVFPNILLFRVFQEVNNYESILEGIKFRNLFVPGDSDYKTAGSVGVMLIFSIIGMIFHFLLAVYVGAVRPGKYGTKKPLLYFLEKSTKSNEYYDEEVEDFEFGEDTPFEKVPKDAFNPGIQIRNLKKEYSTSLLRNDHSKNIQALRGITVDFYKGQITALLGHNGAGKTTMMSILTGMISSTSGSVYINGHNIKHESAKVRNNIGLCPQENMLFPSLSVSEQLVFFGMLKSPSKSRAQVKNEVILLMKKINLFEKRNSLPGTLSGGQKRRVCLGMAVIGEPDIIVLDEPTSGMDPESRRDTWDIILGMRGQKTILISTHDMEEADILGDRIAIVNLGRLRSYGTPMFLKKHFGQGNMEVTLSTETWSDANRIQNELNSAAKITNMDAGKIVLTTPYSNQLPDSLDKLEAMKKTLGITGMSVSLITLEQVFLKVTKDSEDATDSVRSSMVVPTKLSKHSLFLQSLKALIEKKITYSMKNIFTIILMICVPVTSLFFLALEYNIDEGSEIMPMKLNMYRDAKTFYKSYEPRYGEKYNLVTQELSGEPMEFATGTLSDAILNYGKQDLAIFRNNLIAAAEFNTSIVNEGLIANAFFSSSALFSLPISVNLLMNAIIKKELGNEYSTEVIAHQLPDNLAAIAKKAEEMEISSYTICFLFMFFFYPAVALFVIHPLRENLTNIKQLQRMCQVSCFSYWGTMFVIDFVILLVSIIFILFGFFIMDHVADLRIFYLLETLIHGMLLVLFAINVLPLIYSFTFSKRTVSSLITILILVPIGLVFAEAIVGTILELKKGSKFFDYLRIAQKYLFLLFPYVTFYHGQMAFVKIGSLNGFCRKIPNVYLDMCGDSQSTIFLFPKIKQCCELNCYNGTCTKHVKYFNHFEEDNSLEQSTLFLSITPFLYFAILVILENNYIDFFLSKYFRKNYQLPEDQVDDKVKQEKNIVGIEISKLGNNYRMDDTSSECNCGSPSSNYLFMCYELRKIYRNFIAVKEVSFGVRQRECFGLLGTNGAGKTTTFKMLTGELVPNLGSMCVTNKFLHSNKTEYLALMGYCPQNDALVECLNSYEHLRLFALLRGVPFHEVNSEVNKWIDKLNLNLCASQPSGTYSGGNKRRLNIAIALIGNPKLVLLDEPTTGVDPAARRSLWNTIQSCQTVGQSIILTSHSMEECEALCNRLVIMVAGRIVCIGPCEELKQRFGAGYDIQIKLNAEKSKAEMENIKSDVASNLRCELVDENMSYLMFHITDASTSWRKMYDIMYALKGKYESIDDFSVLSSTLEQLFLQFARSASSQANRHI